MNTYKCWNQCKVARAQFLSLLAILTDDGSATTHSIDYGIWLCVRLQLKIACDPSAMRTQGFAIEYSHTFFAMVMNCAGTMRLRKHYYKHQQIYALAVHSGYPPVPQIWSDMSTMAGIRSIPSLWGPLGDVISEDFFTLTPPVMFRYSLSKYVGGCVDVRGEGCSQLWGYDDS